jgi:hypothetical protein
VVDLPIARNMPRSYQPDPLLDPGVTIGWLLAQKSEGRLPETDAPAPRKAADMSLAIAVFQSDSRAPATSCQTSGTSEIRHLDAGRSIQFSGGALEVVFVSGDGSSDPVTFLQSNGHSLVARVPLTLRVSPVGSGGRVTVCS